MSTTQDDPVGQDSDVASLVLLGGPDAPWAAPAPRHEDAHARHWRHRGATFPHGRARRPLPVSVAVVAAVAIAGMMWIGDIRSSDRFDATALTLAAGEIPDMGALRQPVSQWAPDFSLYGFELEDRKRAVRAPGQAVVLSYVREDGRRLLFYRVARSQADSLHPALLREAPASLLAWNDGGTTYALAGEVDGETLLKLGAIAAHAGANMEALSAGRATAAIEAQSATASP